MLLPNEFIENVWEIFWFLKDFGLGFADTGIKDTCSQNGTHIKILD